MKYILFLASFFLLLQGDELKAHKRIPLPYTILKIQDGVEIRQGGFGSSMFKDHSKNDRFYTVTDKGVKGIVPQIGHFEIKNDKITLLETIAIKAKVNPEAIVVLKNGTFWISDENKGDILHISAKGEVLEKIDFIPFEFKKFRKNKSFEGLAISPDENNLYALMQASLKNPDERCKKSPFTRLLKINLKQKVLSQYIYKLESRDNFTSEIVWLDDENFLVIERDTEKPFKNPEAFKKIFKISLKEASDLEKIEQSDEIKQDEKTGLNIKDKTLEEYVNKHGFKKLKKFGIKAVKKTLVLDLVKELDYLHDKPEALWIMDEKTIAILNDDDFGVKKKNGKLKQKFLKNKEIDNGVLYIVWDLDLSS